MGLFYFQRVLETHYDNRYYQHRKNYLLQIAYNTDYNSLNVMNDIQKVYSLINYKLHNQQQVMEHQY